MVEDDDLKTITCCAENKVFSTDRTPWQLTIDALGKTLYKKNQPCWSQKSPSYGWQTGCSQHIKFQRERRLLHSNPNTKMFKNDDIKKQDPIGQILDDFNKSTSTNVENWCSQKTHMYKGSKIMNYKHQNLIAIKLDVFTKPNSKRVGNC